MYVTGREIIPTQGRLQDAMAFVTTMTGSMNEKFKVNFLKDDDPESFLENAFKIVQYGWKREAVPVIHEKKSLIARFFDLLFN